MSEMPYLQQCILVRAAQRDDHRVMSKNADVVMSLYAADLVAREVLTPSGLALARKLMRREGVQH
ncbi:hypothetical protein [Streptomyces aureoverticillatus]|uniref:hypothetical protein n=1 Tax=Streptomyces aureoverticillatus TaxID=66871 RepID=UPI0013D90937|nr:hypothetical protein [Streptomyces aureoverticillatus]QIB44873.1 hypothetical protein G3H79_19110 [Streptomyces aureoverticillatus]